MVELYFRLIISGLRTIDSIGDPFLREKVKIKLEEAGYNTQQ